MTELTRRTALRIGGLAALGFVPLAGCSGSGAESDDPGGADGSGGSSGGSGDADDAGGSGDSAESGGSSGGSDGSGGSGDSSGSSDAGSSSGAPSEVEEYLSGVENYSGVADRTGSERVSVTVGTEANGGNFGFGPAAVRISTGTQVTWEWNGKGGSHNVLAEDGSFESELVAEEGHTFSHTFEESGVFTYSCQPHKAVGMKGAVIVE